MAKAAQTKEKKENTPGAPSSGKYKNDDTFNPPTMRLPKIENENSPVADIADVFAASGYFGDLSPAQIAVQILAGRELGFGAAASMFNLEFDANGAIKFKGSQPAFMLLDYSADIHRMILGLQLSEKANKGDLSASNFRIIPKGDPDAEKASQAATGENGAVICPVCYAQPGELSSVATYNGQVIEVCSAKCSRELMNREKLRALEPENPPNLKTNDERAPESSDFAKIGEAAAEITGTAEKTGESDEDRKSRLKLVVAEQPENHLNAPTAGDENPGETVKFESQSAAAEPDDVPDEITQRKMFGTWRKEIFDMCKELGFLPKTVNDKISKYEAAVTFAAKKQYWETVTKYYDDQTAAVKAKIFDAVKGGTYDREKNPDGFSEYVTALFVPENPDRWTYVNATAVFEALEKDGEIEK